MAVTLPLPPLFCVPPVLAWAGILTTWLVLVLVGVLFVVQFNRLVRGRNLVQEAWSGMDVQLQRRHNLIPNLVETVRGYASHERGALERVVALRTTPGFTDIETRQTRENALTAGLKQLFALAEAYPDLKASSDFLGLQRSLAEIEDQIQMARRYYNGAVRNHNVRVQSFPTNILAKLTGFHPAEFFQLDTVTEREVPKVEIHP